jgi:hypothetical protein
MPQCLDVLVAQQPGKLVAAIDRHTDAIVSSAMARRSTPVKLAILWTRAIRPSVPVDASVQ